jgi:predicted alpha/beta superfamily hydrolase
MIMEQGSIATLQHFDSKILGNRRNIHIYLPPDYQRSDTRYPVVYLHDGQEMFGAKDSWKADRTADALIAQGEIPPIIIVAVDCNGQDRRCEMCHNTPSPSRRMGRRGYVPSYSFDGAGRGVLYEQFLVDEVKTYIDQHYRTLPEKEHTALAGSSMGGIVTFRIGIRRPDVYGMLGLLSPALHWETDEFYNSMTYGGPKIWLDSGMAESYYVDNSRQLFRQFRGLGYQSGKDILFYIQPEAIHTSKYFGERFRSALLWFFGAPPQPVAAEIIGRDVVSVSGHHTVLNTLVHCDNGLTYSDMNANYQVFPEEVLAVAPTGEVDAVRPGEATILYQNGGITAEKKVTVVNSLSEFVRIDIHVHVPEPVLESESLAYHYFTRQKLELQKSGPTDYCGTISVPRDWEFDGYIARETAQSIKRAGRLSGEIDDHRMMAGENQSVSYQVESWSERQHFF